MKSLEEIKKENKEADEKAKKEQQITILGRGTIIRTKQNDCGIEIETEEGVALLTEETLKNIVQLGNKLNRDDLFSANDRIRKVFHEEKIWG